MLSKQEQELQNSIEYLGLKLRTKKEDKEKLETEAQNLRDKLATCKSEISEETSRKDNLEKARKFIDTDIKNKKPKPEKIIQDINKIPGFSFQQLLNEIIEISQAIEISRRLNNKKSNKDPKKYHQECLNDKAPDKNTNSNRTLLLAAICQVVEREDQKIKFNEQEGASYEAALEKNKRDLSTLETKIEEIELDLKTKKRELEIVSQQNQQQPQKVELAKSEDKSEYQIPVESKPPVEVPPAPAPVVDKPAGHERPDNNKNDEEDAEFAFKLKRDHIQKEFKKKRIQFEFNEDWASQFKLHWKEKLDEYWEFRCKKYRVKDKISKSDKANREGFIEDLKMALGNVNYRSEKTDNPFRKTLNQRIQYGIDNYTPGLFSNTPGFFTSFFGNKADDYMNLRGLLTKMKECLEIIDEANKMDWSKMTKNQHLIQP